ncbi:outer membrane protein, cobalt-zinc-cadmium efflux system [Pseudarcicella hirudinis]|uniref:Outer membrane protein, cobalt-zinc-cadmium efflux system n=1 Tax=Pseudarcicella hirudinis TaxID=1079859 RepID=A0A1I5Z2X8_9BACT|nr:TolC family protein [Pseudarcicella hirudinis]SFQ50823.1 outer membrane protein, cobalt-zinc-cadmium efflux system [Pseudarcicella hirudinis]
MKLFWMMAGLCLAMMPAFAQKADSLSITLPQAEEQFIRNNLVLLAQKFNIDASKAAILQAKLLPNPSINIEQTLHTSEAIANDATIGPFGQRAFQIQQLIQLAGKRNKLVQIQQINSEITEYQFSELIRELSFQLKSNFYQIYFLQKSLSMYAEEILTIQGLVDAYQEQYKKGNLPYKEVVRLESFLFTLETEQNNYRKQIIDNQTAIKILLGDSSKRFFNPKVDEVSLEKVSVKDLNLEKLSSLSADNRFDQKIQEASVRLEKANLALQKAMATPDITVGYSYDRAGSYINNYHALTLAMDLPVFNKNQGNIKIAENRIRANQAYFNQSQLVVENELLNAFAKAQETERLYRTFDKNFVGNYEKLIDGVIENYQKRNISLIEFTDFIESYKNTVTQVNALQNDRMQAYELLNFVVGQKVL